MLPGPIVLIAVAVFLGVSATVAAVLLMVQQPSASRAEERLEVLAGLRSAAAFKEGLLKQASVLTEPLDKVPGFVEKIFSRFGNLGLLLQQADTQIPASRLAIISAILGAVGVTIGIVLHLSPLISPLMGISLSFLPLLWVLWRRKRRFRAFAAQLPDALDMLGRALRSGQSLGSGFNMVAGELGPPLGREFGRVFEEQNLGIPLDESLDSLNTRIPNLDLKFFATAVILQRQTGGDLAEILDKIAHLIRERYQIWARSRH